MSSRNKNLEKTYEKCFATVLVTLLLFKYWKRTTFEFPTNYLALKSVLNGAEATVKLTGKVLRFMDYDFDTFCTAVIQHLARDALSGLDMEDTVGSSHR